MGQYPEHYRMFSSTCAKLMPIIHSPPPTTLQLWQTKMSPHMVPREKNGSLFKTTTLGLLSSLHLLFPCSAFFSSNLTFALVRIFAQPTFLPPTSCPNNSGQSSPSHSTVIRQTVKLKTKWLLFYYYFSSSLCMSYISKISIQVHNRL